ncbi:MAG: BACON domain-containing protein [Bacteroidales bacterium]|nr:BACON domain-containing protein [Bacteroidales bacterium]
MKRVLLNIFTAVFMCICMTACYTNIIEDFGDGGDGGNGDGGDGSYYNDFVFSNEEDLNQLIFADEQIITVSFYAKTEWRATVEDQRVKSWVSIEQTEGRQGDFTLQIYIDKNTTGYDRNAYISLSNGNEYIPINIEQQSVNEMGYTPEPDAPVVYANYVNKIIRYISINGTIQQDFRQEWIFDYNPETNMIAGIWGDDYSISSDGTESTDRSAEIRADYFDDMLTINVANFQYGASGYYELFSTLYKQCQINSKNFIKYEYTTREYYHNDGGTSHDEQISDYFYVEDYLKQSYSDFYKQRFVWENGNLSEYGNFEPLDDYFNPIQKRLYTSNANDNTNIDLNQITKITEDASLLLGVYGKRSQNLVSEIVNEDGSKIECQYEFDHLGRVAKITTIQYLFDGSKDATENIYEIQYK